MKLIVHTDGGARGNPGPAAVGVVIEREEESKVESHLPAMLRIALQAGKSKVLVTEFGKRIGETTNNVAEYTAVLEALRNLKSQITMTNDQADRNFEIQFFLDSNLVVQQLNGNFQVKDPHLKKLFFDVRILEQEVGGVVTYSYVPREQNTRADYFVNQALDD
ncbi:MAG: ribonuclease HI family protein [Candidatus Gottesmanbacteria bacterium]|nr:ribonuclease HI family protein [Candidatus Gottesmanbacteria bacterium]